MNLSHTDFTVVAQTAGGSLIPVDVDLELYPHQMPQRHHVSIACGGIAFTDPTFEQIDHETTRVVLSAGWPSVLNGSLKVFAPTSI